MYYIEELEHDTYPYRPNIIKFDDIIYDLSEKLVCLVSKEEKNYIITNDKFHKTVWGESRDEAELAFNFAFAALYKNYAKENDEKLSEKSKELKIELLNIVKADFINL